MKMFLGALLWMVAILATSALVVMGVNAIITHDTYTGSLVALFTFVNILWLGIYGAMVKKIKERDEAIAIKERCITYLLESRDPGFDMDGWREFAKQYGLPTGDEADNEKMDDEDALQALEEYEEEE